MEADSGVIDALRRLLTFFKQKEDANGTQECLSMLSDKTLDYCDCSAESQRNDSKAKQNAPSHPAGWDCPDVGRPRCISLYNDLVKDLNKRPAETQVMAKKNVSMKTRIMLATLREALQARVPY